MTALAYAQELLDTYKPGLRAMYVRCDETGVYIGLESGELLTVKGRYAANLTTLWRNEQKNIIYSKAWYADSGVMVLDQT
jgi:hypothetical protein